MSFGNNQVFGDDVTAVYATEVYPLGTERLVLGSQTGVGDQVCIFVKTDANLVAGDVLQRKLTSTNGNVSPSVGTGAVNAASFAGVALGTVTAATAPYCWIIKRGVVSAKSAAATADNFLVIGVTAASMTTTSSATTSSFGYAFAANSGGFVSCYVSAL
jgi:hypothetical protein